MSGDKPKKFEKTKKQIDAIKLLCQAALFTMLFGGSRSGKTFIIIYAIIIRALKCKSRHLILRKNFNHCKTSIWLDTLPKVIDIAFPNAKHLFKIDKTDFYYTLPKGSEIWIGGLDDKERVEKILGKEYSSIYFNESSQLDISSINIALTRLAEKNELKKKAYFDMNPPNKRHWSYKMFIKLIHPKTKKQLDKDNYVSLLMNPVDNLENLDETYLEILDGLPEKDKKRFKEGKFSDDDDGCLFKAEYIERIYEVLDFDRIIVAVDPAVTSNENSNETGITVEAKKGDFGYVLEDVSGIYKPSEWGQKVIDMYYKWGADRVIGEVNNGGDLVEAVIINIDPNIPYKSVRATRGKVKRAEPIAALYEKGKISHYGVLDKLEEQMEDFETVEKSGKESPDRVDSMVWGFTELFDIQQGQFMVTIL